MHWNFIRKHFKFKVDRIIPHEARAVNKNLDIIHGRIPLIPQIYMPQNRMRGLGFCT